MKKLFSLLLAVSLLLALLPMTVAADALPGDVNGDGVIGAMDVTLIRRHLAGGYGVALTQPSVDAATAEENELSLVPGYTGGNMMGQVAAAEVSGNRVIGTEDVVLLRQYIAGGYGADLTECRVAPSAVDMTNFTPPKHKLPTVEELAQRGEVYYVGATRENKSFVSLLLDLTGDENQKTIFIDEGEYDIFAEYMAEVDAGRIAVPSDEIGNATYMEAADGKWYNAFVPNNTVVYGLGDVTLRFMPTAEQITYGESRVWSPLNIFGSVELYNLNVLVKNGRYALHNDDHNRYVGEFQYYYNCRFVYQLGDEVADGKLLGFNSTIGYGISDDSIHYFDNCEMYFDGPGNHGVFYGHDAGAAVKSSWIFLKDCHIHASDPTNVRVIRLQTLAKNVADRPVYTLVQNCEVNGGLQLNMYHAESVQTYDVLFLNTPRMPVSRTNAYGPVVDPYTVKFY
ncbi:MAG: dockerin type I repeat-containing protein [Oscillospiraceae bacterium]|nr:dockerin type I repeat-containing protein [Oscillospiraceae bacterium]